MDITIKNERLLTATGFNFQQPPGRMNYDATLGLSTPHESRNNLENNTTQPVSRPSSQQSEKKLLAKADPLHNNTMACAYQSIEAKSVPI